MPKNIPSSKVNKLIRMLRSGGCEFYREGRGDHKLYVRYAGKQKRVVPIDMGEKEFSPPCNPILIKFMQTYRYADQLGRGIPRKVINGGFLGES